MSIKNEPGKLARDPKLGLELGTTGCVSSRYKREKLKKSQDGVVRRKLVSSFQSLSLPFILVFHLSPGHPEGELGGDPH